MVKVDPPPFMEKITKGRLWEILLDILYRISLVLLFSIGSCVQTVPGHYQGSSIENTNCRIKSISRDLYPSHALSINFTLQNMSKIVQRKTTTQFSYSRKPIELKSLIMFELMPFSLILCLRRTEINGQRILPVSCMYS